MPEKNSHHVIDAVPATSLADSDIAVVQLLTAEARPPRSNNIEAQSRSDDSNSFFYFSQPSDLSASDSEVAIQYFLILSCNRILSRYIEELQVNSSPFDYRFRLKLLSTPKE